MSQYIDVSEIYKLFDKSGRAYLHVADIDVLPRAKVYPEVHSRYTSDHLCENCGTQALESPYPNTYYHTLHCWACNAIMDSGVNTETILESSGGVAHWIDNADSYICSSCGYETNNPNKGVYGSTICPKCKSKMKR